MLVRTFTRSRSLFAASCNSRNVTRNAVCGGIVGYWESLLQQLKAHVARTRLYERHQEQLQRKLYKLKAEVRYSIL